MKTPKREYKKYYLDPATGEPDEWALGNIDARWKRKNRIRQLKATIARQAEEIEHLRTALAIRAASEYNESIRASIEYVQKHFSMEISQPRMEMEDSSVVYKWKRPIPRWNNSIIDLHLPEAEQP